MSGYVPKRLPAVATCHARGWGVGTVVASGQWKVARPIKALDATTVTLDFGAGDRSHVKSFPPDVREAS